MNKLIEQLIEFLRRNDGINDKARLAKGVSDHFRLTKDRSVYYCGYFAIRFSASASQNFGNTVLSLRLCISVSPYRTLYAGSEVSQESPSFRPGRMSIY